jgi:hypothetical protein
MLGGDQSTNAASSYRPESNVVCGQPTSEHGGAQQADPAGGGHRFEDSQQVSDRPYGKETQEIGKFDD